LTTTSPNLDTLRAFAVTCVLASHILAMLNVSGYIGDHTPGALGYAGVTAFFVHTSLVLMYSLQRLAGLPNVAVRFYIARAMRIYPLSIASVVVMVLFRVPAVPWAPHATYLVPSWASITSHLLLVQDVTHSRLLLGPLWSLPLEMHMYLLLPLCFYAAVKTQPIKLIWLILAGAAAIAVAARYFGKPWIFLPYAPCFLAGVMAYRVSTARRFSIPAYLWPVGLLLWFGILFKTLAIPSLHANRFVGSWVLCVILGLAIGSFRESSYRFWNYGTSTVAKYSYGIYLFHAPVMYFVFAVLRVHNPAIAAIVWLSCTFAVAALCYHLLESPCIKLGKRWASRFVTHPVIAEPIAVEVKAAAASA